MDKIEEVLKKISNMYSNSSYDLNELNSLFAKITDLFQQKDNSNLLALFLKDNELSLDFNEQVEKIERFFKVDDCEKIKPLILDYLKIVDNGSLDELKVGAIYSVIVDDKRRYYELLLAYNLSNYKVVQQNNNASEAMKMMLLVNKISSLCRENGMTDTEIQEFYESYLNGDNVKLSTTTDLKKSTSNNDNVVTQDSELKEEALPQDYGKKDDDRVASFAKDIHDNIHNQNADSGLFDLSFVLGDFLVDHPEIAARKKMSDNTSLSLENDDVPIKESNPPKKDMTKGKKVEIDEEPLIWKGSVWSDSDEKKLKLVVDKKTAQVLGTFRKPRKPKIDEMQPANEDKSDDVTTELDSEKKIAKKVKRKVSNEEHVSLRKKIIDKCIKIFKLEEEYGKSRGM